ncbi:hypothetical protein [Kitasatospora sp. NPDC059327]|uniref:variant leucine-rich repeat-containing protein n=1 Tax=Kitasatospora sp. NPDC059327 TaxID=3346803 RepID=UPI0036913292
MSEYSPELSGLAENPNLPQRLLDHLITLADEDLCQALVRRDALTARQARELARRSDPWTLRELIARGALPVQDIPSHDPWSAVAAAGRADVPAGWIHDLARHDDPSVRVALVEYGGRSEYLLDLLADDPHLAVVCAVADSAALPDRLARRLAARPDVPVRDALARNTATPPDILAALSADGGSPPVERCGRCLDLPRACGDHEADVRALRSAALQNPATPATGLERFHDSPDSWVRAALAARPDLSDALYRRLAADPESPVRRSAAANPAVGEPLIRALAADPDRSVRAAVTANPALPMSLLVRLAPTVRLGTGLWPRVAAASPEELRDLARSTTAQVRALVAARPDLPADLAAVLARDADPSVAKRVAAHPALAPDLLHELAERHGPSLYPSLARNPRCPPGLLHAMAVTGALGHAALLAVAQHPSASPATLRLCLASPYDRVRASAAANPALPVAAMVRMLGAARTPVAEQDPGGRAP